MKKFDIVIATVPHREERVVEVWYDDVIFAEVYRSDAGPMIYFYPHALGRKWNVSLTDFYATLQEAVRRYRALGYPSE